VRLPARSLERHIAVVVADANMMACRMISFGLKRHRHFDIVASVVDTAGLLEALKTFATDVLLLNANLRDGPLTGFQLLSQIRELHPRVKVVLLLNRPDPHLIVEGFRCGMKGAFALAESEIGALCKCVYSVHDGQFWANSQELGYILLAFSQSPPVRVVSADGVNLLTNREHDVVKLVADGLGNRQIAERLGLSENTVKNYLFRIFNKLGISNRVELVLYALTDNRTKPRPAVPWAETTGEDVPA
jgi:DNA-binding NarL/FixJ family response regulator